MIMTIEMLMIMITITILARSITGKKEEENYTRDNDKNAVTARTAHEAMWA